ncbi:hypothetical protein NDA06_25470 [Trichocoleus sp. ST-U1]
MMELSTGINGFIGQNRIRHIPKKQATLDGMNCFALNLIPNQELGFTQIQNLMIYSNEIEVMLYVVFLVQTWF